MKSHFEKLKKISSDYRAAVDDLAAGYARDAAPDVSFNDQIRAERAAARNADYNSRIDRLAEKARQEATPEIAKLREIVQQYVTTSTDPATMATLQGLLSAGVELSDAEIKAFAQKGGYGVLRMLEKPSGGHIQAPNLEAFEQDLRDISSHFGQAVYYRGGLANIYTGGFFGNGAYTGTGGGLTGAVSSAIVEGQLDKFSAKLDEIAGRWAVLHTSQD